MDNRTDKESNGSKEEIIIAIMYIALAKVNRLTSGTSTYSVLHSVLIVVHV